jgi:protein SCO1/2
MKIRALLALLLTACLLTAAPLIGAPAEVPADSVYQLDAAFTDQDGRAFTLADRRGKPQVVAMFYTSCRFVCPLLVDSAKGVEHALGPAERERIGILLISLDPARDDTAALRSVFDKRKLDATRWSLARTSEHDVRTVAALLGVRYRALPDGEFNHTSALVLLDAEGRRLASTTTLGAVPDPEFMKAVRAALAGKAPAP